MSNNTPNPASTAGPLPAHKTRKRRAPITVKSELRPAYRRPETPASMSNQIHQIMRDEIVRGVLVPGRALSELELAARYGVSRQPVREAFIRLVQEHLVVVLPQRGTFVRRIVAQEVMDARFVREAVELAVARQAALNATSAHIKALRELVVQQAEVSPGNNARFLELDEAFHRQLAIAAGCEYAWRVVDQVKAQMDRVRYLSYEAATPLSRLVQQHNAVVDAVALRDPEAASRAMQTHLGEILQSLPELARLYPALFEG